MANWNKVQRVRTEGAFIGCLLTFAIVLGLLGIFAFAVALILVEILGEAWRQLT